jgi:hypothetical protein
MVAVMFAIFQAEQLELWRFAKMSSEFLLFKDALRDSSAVENLTHVYRVVEIERRKLSIFESLLRLLTYSSFCIW